MIVQAPGAPAGPLSGLSLWVTDTIGITPTVQGQVLKSLAILVALWVIRRVLLRLVRRGVENPRTLYQWGKVSSRLTTFVAFLLIGPIWLGGIGSLGTFLGLLSAGLAIALREPVANLAGWGFILWRRPFEVGDRIEIGSSAGDVVDISLFQFTLLEIGNWVDADQSTGRVIHVPNATLFHAALANSTAEFPYIWNEVPVLITFESNWRVAKELLESVIQEIGSTSGEEVRAHMRRASHNLLIPYKNFTPIVYLSVRDSGILLTARYPCDPRARRGTSEGFWVRILEEFAKRSDVELAYPTFRVTGADGRPTQNEGART